MFKNTPFKFLSLIIVVLVILLSLRGVTGNPDAFLLNTGALKEQGPFELSPERGRFALTYSLVEDKSFYFSLPLAKFVTPDLGYINGNFVSLFAPGVSFLVIPGYIIGKYFGVSQVGTFSVIGLFAIFNFLLIIAIAQNLKAGKTASLLAGITFLFASPAFSYAVSLYQHHISTFLILAALYLLISFNSFLATAAIWLLIAASIPIDYPNLFLMAPIALMTIIKSFVITKDASILRIAVKHKSVLAISAVLLPLIFFMWFNYKSYGNPFQFSGTVASVKGFDQSGKPILPKTKTPEPEEINSDTGTSRKSAVNFFRSRNITNGLYVHIFSHDRGIFVFTPVMIFGVLGISYIYRKNKKKSVVLSGIVGMNIILYSMWGDPWGGWAFGSRYLIPAYAILAIGVAFFIERNVNRLRSLNTGIKVRAIVLVTLFTLSFTYSLFVSTVGALTTSAIPPQVEVDALEKVTHRKEYSNYFRGIESLNSDKSKAVVFTSLADKYLSAWQYFSLVFGLLITLSFTNLIYLIFKYKKEKQINLKNE